MKTKEKSGTTKSTPWQVKGVEPETREAVKKAARKSGKTIGDWVNETLHRAAVDELTGQANLPAKQLEQQLSEISEKIDTLSKPFWLRLFGK